MAQPREPIALTSTYGNLLRQMTFMVFWSGRIVSGLGDVLFMMAAMWYLVKTGSPLDLAILPALTRFAPLITSQPLATLADRLPKKRILITLDLFRGGITISVALRMIAGHASPFLLIGANLLLSLCGQIFGPASEAIFSHMVANPEQDLVPANGWFGAGGELLQWVGYGLGGLVVSIIHPDHAVLLDGILFFLSACALSMIPIPDLQASSGQGWRAFWTDMTSGVRFLWERKALRAYLSISALMDFVGAPLAIFSVTFSKLVLHGGARDFGILEASMGTGGIIAARIAAKVSQRVALWRIWVFSLDVFGIAIGFVAESSTLIIMFVAMGTASFALALQNVAFGAMFQRVVPHTIRGRASAAVRLTVTGGTGLVCC